MLEAAHVDRARLLIVATPKGFQTRRIVELARQANPRIDTAVRTHTVGELAYFEQQGVGVAIMGARELALGLVNHALKSFGISDEKAALITLGARTERRS